MTEFKLVARSAFGLDRPLAEEWPGFSLAEIGGLSVWWMSAAAGDIAALDKACAKHLGAGLPERGRHAAAPAGTCLHWAGDRQWFVTGELTAMPAAVAKLAAITDQSDGWVAIRLEGARTRDVLEKICLLDLHPSVFVTGMSARTPVEGMHALIACEDAGAGTFALMFQRSSARSFIDHVRHAAGSACRGE